MQRLSVIRVTAAAAVIMYTASCSTGPEYAEEVLVDRRVERITLNLSRIHEHGHVLAAIYFYQGEPELAEHERTKILFETSNGDREEIWGPPNQFILHLKRGYSPSQMDARVRAFGGINLFPVLENSTVVRILRYDLSRTEAHRALAKWEEVEAVEYDERRNVSVPGYTGPFGSGSEILTTSTGVAGDARLRVAPGDTVWATYQNKVGTPVTVWGVVPSP